MKKNMKLFNEETIDQILDSAWLAYRSIQSSIRTLESIGLSVDGCRDDTGRNLSSLFSALSSIEDAIFAALSVPCGQADQASAVLSSQYERHQDETRFPDAIKAGIRNAVARDPGRGRNGKPFDVTVAATGVISAWSRDGNTAMDYIRELPTAEILRQADWAGIDVTDGAESFRA